jgi:hypothetical protein
MVRFAAVVVVAALVLASCGRDRSETIIVNGSSSSGITVQATGISMAVPDAVRMSFTVTAVADTSENALAKSSNAAEKVRGALADNGVKEIDIATQTVTVYPEYNYTPDGGQTQIGYRASQSFEVVIHATGSAGAVVDAVVAAGGDLVQIGSVIPVVLETSVSAKKARADAISNALAKAEDYAKLLDVKLGSVEYVTELSAPTVFPMMRGDAAVGTPDAATKISLSEQEITVTIEVRWLLK